MVVRVEPIARLDWGAGVQIRGSCDLWLAGQDEADALETLSGRLFAPLIESRPSVSHGTCVGYFLSSRDFEAGLEGTSAELVLGSAHYHVTIDAHRNIGGESFLEISSDDPGLCDELAGRPGPVVR